MNIKNIIKEIIHRGRTPEKAAMDYCYAHGFTSGKNFHYYSGYCEDWK